MSDKLLKDIENLYDEMYFDEGLEDLVTTISLGLFSEGATPEEVVLFFIEKDEEYLLETYIDIVENESILTEEFITEHAEQLDEVVGLLARGLGAVGKGLAKGGSGLVKGAIKAGAKGAKSVADITKAGAGAIKGGAGARGAISAMGKSAGRDIKRTLGPAAEKLKGIVSKPAVKGALGLGALGGAFALGRMTSVPGGQAKTTPTPPAPTLPGSKGGVGGTGSGGSGGTKKTTKTPKAPKIEDPNKKYRELIKQGKTQEAEKYGLGQWAKANPKLAIAAAERERIRGTAQTDNPMMKDMRDKLPVTPSVQAPEVSTLGKGHQALTQNPNAAVSPKEDKKKKDQKEAYEIVLDYLLSEGHADTIDEANYIMMQMSSEYIQSIVEGVMPEPIDFEKHKAAQKTQKIYNLGKGTNNPNEAQSALKRTGPQLPGV